MSGFGSILGMLVLMAGVSIANADPCDNDACCVNPATCVVTDKQTLAGLTVDDVIGCEFNLGSYVKGGNGGTGLAPANYPANLCGLSFSFTGVSPATALNGLDHQWLQSTTTPKVVDLGAPVNTVFVFVAVDHGPFPEEGIESTVWGSSSSDISSFPTGWTLATLTTIWKQGWEEPAVCEPGDNADDFTGQYSFPGTGFRFVAVHADFSISIFDDPSHTTWTGSADDSGVDGWQSFDDEIDAVGTPVCDPNVVVADAGPDLVGSVGEQLCFDGSGSFAVDGIATIGWDLDGDNEIDVTGTEACIDCEGAAEGQVTLFVTDACGCVDSDTAVFACVPCEDPDPRTQGFWRRVCKKDHPEQSDRSILTDDLCDDLNPDPHSDPCERARSQFAALLLNVDSGRVQAGCVATATGGSVADLVAEIEDLIVEGTNGSCKAAADLAASVNEGGVTEP